MKKGKLVNVSADELGNIAQLLGAKRVLYRDTPLFNESQIPEVVNEFNVNNCDSIIFDKGAVFDSPAYDLAHRCVDAIIASLKASGLKTPIRVVLFNAPEL